MACSTYLVPLVGVCSWLAQLLLQLVDVAAPGSHVQGVGHLLRNSNTYTQGGPCAGSGRGFQLQVGRGDGVDGFKLAGGSLSMQPRKCCNDILQPRRQGARCCYSVPTANKLHVMIDPRLCLVDAVW